MKRIRIFFMNLLFNEKCTCHKYNKEGEAAGCYICSNSFKLIPEIIKRFLIFLFE